MNLSDYLASMVRTVVPIAVGLLLEWVAKKTGVVVPATSVAPIVAGAAATAYYALVRLAEHKWPAVGWLLGLAVKPSYSTPTPPAVPPVDEVP